MNKPFIILLVTSGLITSATAQQKKSTPAKVINKSEVEHAQHMRRNLEQEQLNAAPVRLGKKQCEKKKKV